MVIPSLSGESNASDDLWIVVDYELQMYFETRSLSKHLNIKRSHDLVFRISRNAVVESMILHTRILSDILISESQHDDIMLKDLLPEWFNSETGQTLILGLQDAYGKRSQKGSPRWLINKMLAHPTRWRKDRFDYTVPLRQVEGPIFEILSAIEPIVSRPVLTYYVTGIKYRRGAS